jgi:hypothetical protein
MTLQQVPQWHLTPASHHRTKPSERAIGLMRTVFGGAHRSRRRGSRSSAHRQMSMPKPVRPNVATTTPLGRPAAQTAHRQHAGLLELDAQPSAARIRLSEGAARKVSAVDTASVRRAYIPETYAASGPNREPGAQNRPACPAMAATRRLWPILSPHNFVALWSQAHMPSCNLQVTSTSIHMAKPSPVSAARGYAPLKRTHCLWLEQFQIAEYGCLLVGRLLPLSRHR